MRMFEAKCLTLLSLLASGASAANFLNTCKEIKRAISPASEVFYPGSCFHGFYFTGLRNDTNSLQDHLSTAPISLTHMRQVLRIRLAASNLGLHKTQLRSYVLKTFSFYVYFADTTSSSSLSLVKRARPTLSNLEGMPPTQAGALRLACISP